MNRPIIKLAVVTVALSLLSASTPVEGSCGSAALVSTTDASGNKSFVWTEFVFTPNYYTGYPGYAPAMYPGNPPVTAEFAGNWWALGTGDPVVGAGDDNGAWGPEQWFYYYGLPTYGFFESAQIFTNWGAAAAVDGCLFNSGPTGGPDPGEECTCVLLTDQDGQRGYYSIIGNSTDALSDTYLTQPGSDGNNNAGPIVLRPVPRPSVIGTYWIPATGTLALEIRVQENPGGYILDPAACGGCGPVGYQVVEQRVPRGSPPPDDRSIDLWDVPPQLGGAPQGITPLGETVTVESFCPTSPDEPEVYLATAFYFDSGYRAEVVSDNSIRVECNILAEPQPIRPRVDPDAPRESRRPKSRPGR